MGGHHVISPLIFLITIRAMSSLVSPILRRYWTDRTLASTTDWSLDPFMSVSTLTSQTSQTLLTRMSNISDFFIAMLIIEFLNHPVNDSANSDVLFLRKNSYPLPGCLWDRYGGLHSLDARMDRLPATPRSRSSSCLNLVHIYSSYTLKLSASSFRPQRRSACCSSWTESSLIWLMS